MHRRLTMLAAGLALAAVPTPALAQSGGAAAPDAAGGVAFGQPIKTKAKLRLRATTFTVSADSIELGQPLRFTWRVDGPVKRVTGRVALLPAGGGRSVSIALGTRRAGARSVRTWTVRG